MLCHPHLYIYFLKNDYPRHSLENQLRMEQTTFRVFDGNLKVEMRTHPNFPLDGFRKIAQKCVDTWFIVRL